MRIARCRPRLRTSGFAAWTIRGPATLMSRRRLRGLTACVFFSLTRRTDCCCWADTGSISVSQVTHMAVRWLCLTALRSWARAVPLRAAMGVGDSSSKATAFCSSAAASAAATCPFGSIPTRSSYCAGSSHQVLRCDARQVARARLSHHRGELAVEDVDHGFHARLAERREAPCIGPADTDGTRTECQCLEHIRAAP